MSNILIIGAGRGIGLGLVNGFLAQASYIRVFATSIDSSANTELNAVAEKFSGRVFIISPVNIQDQEQLDAAVASV